MSQKEDSKPVVLKGPSALRSIIAGSTAGALEIGALVPVPLKRSSQLLAHLGFNWH